MRQSRRVRLRARLRTAGAALAENIAKGDRANYMLFGGYDGAERVYFGVFPDGFLPDGSLFPIVRLTVTDRSGRGFTHRDVLGTLMSEGIERSTVGDILIGSPDSALFVSASVAEHIMAETDKIASCGVTVARSDGGELPEGGGFEERSDTVASARLDCVVAAVCRVSRGKAVIGRNTVRKGHKRGVAGRYSDRKTVRKVCRG